MSSIFQWNFKQWSHKSKKLVENQYISHTKFSENILNTWNQLKHFSKLSFRSHSSSNLNVWCMYNVYVTILMVYVHECIYLLQRTREGKRVRVLLCAMWKFKQFFPPWKKKCASIMSIVAYHAKLSYDMQTDCIRTIEIEDTKCYKMLIKIKNWL